MQRREKRKEKREKRKEKKTKEDERRRKKKKRSERKVEAQWEWAVWKEYSEKKWRKKMNRKVKGGADEKNMISVLIGLGGTNKLIYEW